jgi:hypothetical protein
MLHRMRLRIRYSSSPLVSSTLCLVHASLFPRPNLPGLQTLIQNGLIITLVPRLPTRLFLVTRPLSASRSHSLGQYGLYNTSSSATSYTTALGRLPVLSYCQTCLAPARPPLRSTSRAAHPIPPFDRNVRMAKSAPAADRTSSVTGSLLPATSG